MAYSAAFTDPDAGLTADDCRMVYETWRTLLELASWEVETRLDEVVDALRGLCQADEAWLVVSHRAATAEREPPFYGWDVVGLDHPRGNPPCDAVPRELMTDPDSVFYEPSKHLCRTAGEPRSYLLRDIFHASHPKSVAERRYCELVLALQVADRLVCVCPVDEDTEIYMSFDRYLGGAPFTPRDRNVLAMALGGLTPLWTGLARCLGTIDASSLLTRRERDVLLGLLEGHTIAEIAAAHGISDSTVRQYTRYVYHKFDVGSRAELAALWMRGKRETPPTSGSD